MVLLVWLVIPGGVTGHIQVMSISFFTIPRLEIDVLTLYSTRSQDLIAQLGSFNLT